MTLYSYDGPVLEFDRVVTDHWHGETYAVSKAKARCNLAFHFKNEIGKVPQAKITLPGKIIAEGDE